jgi:uncharacterized protein YecE (DUF72 family)
VVEARHLSWWNKEVIDAFTAHRITFSGISYPSALPDEVVQNNEPVYYRFHGRPVLYKSLYTQQEMEEFAAAIRPGTQQVYVYFNNTWGTSALINSRQLISLIENDQLTL